MEYTDATLPWARILNFNVEAFPALGKLVSSEFTSDFYSSEWHKGKVPARWFAHQARLNELAGKLLPVLEEDQEEDLMEAVTEFDVDSVDLPQSLRDLMTLGELDFIRDFWEDATSEWEISGNPHDHSRSLMVRTGAFMSTVNSLPDTVGELKALLALVPDDTLLTSDDHYSSLRLERAGKFAVVDIGGVSDMDNDLIDSFEGLAADAPALV